MPKRAFLDEDHVPEESPPKKAPKKPPELWSYPLFEPLSLEQKVPNFGYPLSQAHDF